MKYLFCVILLISTLNLSAQDDHYVKGQNMVGLAFRGSLAKSDVSTYSTFNLRYGRFLSDQFNLGMELGTVRFNQFTKAFEFGPFARFYLIPQNFAPIVEVNYQRGTISQNTSASSLQADYNKVSLGGGFAFTGSSGIGAEMLAEYFWFFPSQSTTNGQLVYLARLSFYF